MADVVRLRPFRVIDCMTKKQVGPIYRSKLDALIAADEADGPWINRHHVKPAMSWSRTPPFANDNARRSM